MESSLLYQNSVFLCEFSFTLLFQFVCVSANYYYYYYFANVTFTQVSYSATYR